MKELDYLTWKGPVKGKYVISQELEPTDRENYCPNEFRVKSPVQSP